jgi:uncharacterized protein YaiL (DUF2058 family)
LIDTPMADSLRDQLLALGFARSKPAEKQNEQRRDKPRGAPPHGKGKPPHGAQRHQQQGPRPKGEVDLAQAYALRARTEREAKEREQREAQERARLKKERKEKLAKLLADKALNAKDADVARNFPHGDKIRRVYVTNEQLVQLNRGELGVVQLAGRYLVVTREVALAAQAVDEAALVLLPDPNAPADDDVPPDLVW